MRVFAKAVPAIAFVGGLDCTTWGRSPRRSLVLAGVAAASWTGTIPISAQALSAQTRAPVPTLLFDGVTVVDVAQGTLVPTQRVVIVGNRIQAVGPASQVRVPAGARRVDARGKYLIPGLWDLHVHPGTGRVSDGTAMVLPADRLTTEIFYPFFLANGVTGIRDAWSYVPLDTLRGWHREIVAGTRVGPPRQILSGAAIDEYTAEDAKAQQCRRPLTAHVCLVAGDTADARRLVTELRAAGADMIKMYGLSTDMFAFLAAEARRQGLPIGGHVGALTPLAASDLGARIVDHDADAGQFGDCGHFFPRIYVSKSTRRSSADSSRLGTTLAQCMQTVAARLRQNDTWLLPTILFFNGSGGNGEARAQPIVRHFSDVATAFWAGTLPRGNWLRLPTAITSIRTAGSSYDTLDGLFLLQRFGLPFVAGTDAVPRTSGLMPPGFSLHAELASYAANGVSPLEVLRAATLNPAKLLHGTDSLGTIAPGKLADLVLLDANPLEDITNTTTIRAVVANGRYFDRPALDRLLTEARAKMLPIPLAAMTGAEKGVVLPLAAVHVDSALQADPRYAPYRDQAESVTRAWADSMLGAALAAQAGPVTWVLPEAVRALARTGQVSDPDSYREGWELPRASLFEIADTTRAELRRLVAATGGSTVFVPVYLRFRLGLAPRAGVCVHLAAEMVDGRTGEYLWRSFLPGHDAGEAVIVGCGATPAAALAAALDTAIPRSRRRP